MQWHKLTAKCRGVIQDKSVWLVSRKARRNARAGCRQRAGNRYKNYFRHHESCCSICVASEAQLNGNGSIALRQSSSVQQKLGLSRALQLMMIFPGGRIKNYHYPWKKGFYQLGRSLYFPVEINGTVSYWHMRNKAKWKPGSDSFVKELYAWLGKNDQQQHLELELLC